MFRFFIGSLISSASECLILSLSGAASIASSWAIIEGAGFEKFSVNFCIIVIIFSFFLLWISIFWINVLFIPIVSGRISLFSPLTSYFFQIPFKTSRSVQVVAGFWLTLWLLVVTIGWSLVLKENPIIYHLNNKIPYKRCCNSNQNNFYFWFITNYLQNITKLSEKAISNREFIVYQPSTSYTYVETLNGMFTAFVLAMLSGREFLINTNDEFSSTLKKPGWNWIYREVINDTLTSYAHYDLSVPPSHIITPLFNWESLLLDDINRSFLGNNKVVYIDARDFLVPFFYANPHHRGFLCNICDISQIYTALSRQFLRYTDQIVNEAESLTSQIHNNYSVSLVSASGSNLKQMVDTSLRCLSKQSKNEDQHWVIVQLGNIKKKLIKFHNISQHRIHIFGPSEIPSKYSREFRTAVLYYICSKADYVISFSGDSISESISLSSDIPIYVVYKNYPVCADVAVRLPCIKSWKRIMGSIGNDFDKVMIAEFINQYKCSL